MPAKLLIFSAPSGAGKSTVVRRIRQQIPDLEFSVSATNREPRGDERDGESYHFLTTADFQARIQAGEFLEWEEVYPGKYYGTLRSEIDHRLAAGKSVVLDIDVVGGCRIKELYGDRALSFFIAPPSLEVLRQRLVGRGTDSAENIEVRMGKASAEMTYQDQFDVIIVNDRLDLAVAEVMEHIQKAGGSNQDLTVS